MVDVDTVRGWQGRTMVDRDGDRIGNIDAIYVDDQTGEPEWALVNTGLFGTRSTFVPIAQAAAHGDQVQVPYEKQRVKDAPNMDSDGHLSEQEEQELWRHYGLEYGGGYAAAGTTGETGTGRAETYDDRDTVGRDVSGPTTDQAMTRSEEELQVGTETRERGRARLHKYVTTEQQTVTVPVSREEVRLEREPISDANLDAATSGLFSAKTAFVPLAQAHDIGDSVQVPYDKAQVKNAPTMRADGSLSQDEEAELYRHYGLDYSQHRSDSGLPAGERDRDRDGIDDHVQDTAVGRDTSGPTTDDAMTRSEEELRVGTQTRERGRARLRKYVTTEQQTVTVPVSREEVRVEREPISDANIDDATSGPAISEEEHEVTLREETPVVEKRAVPRERVRLDTETVTDERQVSEEVRKEQIQVDSDQDQLPRQDQR